MNVSAYDVATMIDFRYVAKIWSNRIECVKTLSVFLENIPSSNIQEDSEDAMRVPAKFGSCCSLLPRVSFLECDAVQPAENLPTFRQHMLTPSTAVCDLTWW